MWFCISFGVALSTECNFAQRGNILSVNTKHTAGLYWMLTRKYNCCQLILKLNLSSHSDPALPRSCSFSSHFLVAVQCQPVSHTLLTSCDSSPSLLAAPAVIVSHHREYQLEGPNILGRPDTDLPRWMAD